MSIRDEIKEGNKKYLSDMNANQKLKHFWHYYKIHFFVVIGLIAFVVYLILLNTVLKPLPYGFVGYALNTQYYMEQDLSPIEKFTEEFTRWEGINTEEAQVVFDVSNAVSPDSTEMLDMAIDMKLVHEGQEGNLDVLIGGQSQIDFYIINGFYSKTLDQLLSEEEFNAYDEQGLIYYYYDEDSDKEYPIGIYITDAPRIRELGLYKEDEEVILAVVSYSERTQTALDFAKFLFEIP